MATECYSQLGFGFQPKLVVDFAGGTLTTDAGLLLVREFDEQLQLSAEFQAVRDQMLSQPRGFKRWLYGTDNVLAARDEAVPSQHMLGSATGRTRSDESKS